MTIIFGASSSTSPNYVSEFTHLHHGHTILVSVFLGVLATLNPQLLFLLLQGLPVLVSLVETDFQKYGPLIHVGVNSVWWTLELQGMSNMKKSSRLLAADAGRETSRSASRHFAGRQSRQPLRTSLAAKNPSSPASGGSSRAGWHGSVRNSP